MPKAVCLFELMSLSFFCSALGEFPILQVFVSFLLLNFLFFNLKKVGFLKTGQPNK